LKISEVWSCYHILASLTSSAISLAQELSSHSMSWIVVEIGIKSK